MKVATVSEIRRINLTLKKSFPIVYLYYVEERVVCRLSIWDLDLNFCEMSDSLTRKIDRPPHNQLSSFHNRTVFSHQLL
jgi:hypothetical protein